MWRLDRRRVGVRIILRTATAALAAVGAALWIRRRRARRGPKPAPGACAAARLRAVTLVLSDMDGTWLGSAHAPTAGGARARAEAEAAGLTFCFATGRCPASAQRASRVDLSRRPGVYANGSLVRGADGAELYALDLPEPLVDELEALGAAAAARCAGQVAVITCDRDDHYAREPRAGFARHLHLDYGDPDPIRGRAPRAQLVHLVGPREAMDALERDARAAVGARASVARNLPTNVTVTHARANKGEAARALAAHLALGGAVLAIGDSGNDVPMLKAVDVGVAMANARAETVDAAEFVTAATNDDAECGVLEVVRAVLAARA